MLQVRSEDKRIHRRRLPKVFAMDVHFYQRLKGRHREPEYQYADEDKCRQDLKMLADVITKKSLAYDFTDHDIVLMPPDANMFKRPLDSLCIAYEEEEDSFVRFPKTHEKIPVQFTVCNFQNFFEIWKLSIS